MNTKFYICRRCGNLVGLIEDKGGTLVCCRTEMEALVPNTTDAAGEKHLPAITLSGDILEVNVGSIDHPMAEEHFIEWIYVETERGGQRRVLKPGEAPHARFNIADDKPVAVYAYCNLHGLWMTELKA